MSAVNTSNDSSGGYDLGYNGFSVSMNYFTGIPDPSALQDPYLTVLFRSLAKRDSTTKERALNDFKNTIRSGNLQQNDTDGIISSWIQMYPKLASDDAKTVRSNSHLVQGELLNYIGGKAFSKYLKSCVPVWIHGMFDSESVVADAAFKSLLKSFQDDADKVNNKIWIIFAEQIISFVHLNVVLETPDSLSNSRYTKEELMNTKYERVLNGSLMMLIKLIQLINSSTLDLLDKDELWSKFSGILKSEKLWDYLSVVIKDESFNGVLFKSLLILLKTVFNSDGEKVNVFIKNFKDVKVVYKLISKKFIKHVTFKSLKQKIVLSNLILQFWDTLNVLTKFSSLPCSKALKIKKNFWEYGGDRSRSRLMAYLKLGNCQSNPIYYTIIQSFFSNLSILCEQNDNLREEFVSFSDEETARSILVNIFCADLTKISSWTFKEKAILCIMKTSNVFVTSIGPKSRDLLLQVVQSCFDAISVDSANSKGKSSTINHFADSLLENFEEDLKLISTSLSNHIIDFNGLIENKPNKAMLSTYVQIFNRLAKEAAIIELVKDVLENLESDDSEIKRWFIFSLFIEIYDSKVNLTDNQIKNFLQEVPTFIEEDFVDEPLILLQRILQSEDKNVNVDELLNDYFLKLSAVRSDKLHQFISIISSEGIILSTDSELFQYLKELSHKEEPSSEELEMLYSFLSEDTIFSNLLGVASASEKLALDFMKNCIKHNVDLHSMDHNEHFEDITRIALLTISHSESVDFINYIKKFDIHMNSVIYKIIKSVDMFYDFAPIVKIMNKSWLPLDELNDDATRASNQMDLSCLSMSNSLSQNSLLFIKESNKCDIDMTLISVSKFLQCYISFNDVTDSKIMVMCGELGEYLQDYLFFTSSTDHNLIDEILHLKETMTKSFLDFVGLIELPSLSNMYTNVGNETFNAENELSANELVYFELLSNLNSNKQRSFYSARVLKCWTEHIIEVMNVQEFEELNLDVFKLASNYELLAVIMCSAASFMSSSSSFDRSKNFLVSELLSRKDSEQVLSKGLKELVLINNFFSIGSEIIAPRKLSMLVNQLRVWLEFDTSYDAIFNPIRLQLCVLLTGLISNQSMLTDQLIRFSIDLLSDNISIIELMPENIELRYYSYKLYGHLISKKDHYPELWKENHLELEESFLESLFNMAVQANDEKKSNQPVALTHDVAFRMLPKIELSVSLLGKMIHSIYETLGASKSVTLQRIATSVAQKFILASQQEFVLEHQLAKSSLEEDSNVENSNLPVTLLHIIGEVDTIEYDAESSVGKYLWGWFLIFCHCTDVPYSIQQEYLDILQEGNHVHELLNFIFEYSDVTQLIKVVTLVGEKIDLGAKKGYVNIHQYDTRKEHSFDSFEAECRFLSAHLFYLSFRYFGSSVQSWFNSLRDRQLKLKVEEFAVNYISPLIISFLLNDVLDTKQKLVKDNENLMIKVAETTNEIRCSYQVDEQKMEILIKIPNNYPIRNVTVEGPSRLGVKPNHWRAWLLASQRIISLKNGSISDAIELFSRNVSLHFSGFEDCAICYSILHQDKSLPSKVCPTCSNKFHAACLYKWFKSSGGSTCPLCRTSFTFRNTRNEL